MEVMIFKGSVIFMEAINKFYLINGRVDKVKNFINNNENGSIIYEVLRVINGNPAFLDAHIERMKKSFELINKKVPFTNEELISYVNKVIESNDKIVGNIKITYNTASEELKVYYIKHSYPKDELYKYGVKTILYYGERENPNAKIVNSTFRERVTEEIKKANAFEAILVDRNGFITEGSKSNIFAIEDGKLVTAKGEAVLKGITREKIMKIAQQIGLEVEEKDIKASNIEKLEAMFISGTSPKILPIAFVGEIELDVNNLALRKLMKAYDELLSGKI